LTGKEKKKLSERGRFVFSEEKKKSIEGGKGENIILSVYRQTIPSQTQKKKRRGMADMSIFFIGKKEKNKKICCCRRVGGWAP